MIRTAWVFLAGGILTMVLSARILVARWLRRPSVPELCHRLPRIWARAVLRMSGVRVRFEGLEWLAGPGPAVVVANHQSWFDVFALAAHLPVTYRFVAKEELSRIPLFGPTWQVCGHISLARGDRSRAVASLNRAGDQVREEQSVIILFPEGTRSADGRLQAFKKGAFVLAIHGGFPVVPMGIIGSRKVMPKGSWRIRPGEILVRLGQPIPTQGLEHRDRDPLLRRARGAVAALMEDPDALGGSDEEPDDHRNSKNPAEVKEGKS